MERLSLVETKHHLDVAISRGVAIIKAIEKYRKNPVTFRLQLNDVMFDIPVVDIEDEVLDILQTRYTNLVNEWKERYYALGGDDNGNSIIQS